MKSGSEKVFVLLMILRQKMENFSPYQLEAKFNISKNIMKFNSIISAVKHAGKQNVYNSYKLLTPFIPSFVKTILKSKKGTKDMYLLLIRNNIVSNGQKKWEEILALGLDETKWREIFKLPFIVTQNTKLQWLIQYRINQRILGTNKFLYKIKIKDNAFCTFCQEDLFWNCEIVQVSLMKLILGQMHRHFLFTNLFSIIFLYYFITFSLF